MCAPLLLASVKVEVKSVLRIGSAHNNVRTLYVRYSDSTSYFKKYSSSKCKQTVCLHYGLDFHFKTLATRESMFVKILYFPR